MNQEIKMKLKETGVKQWQIADVLGISEGTFCRMMRHELSAEKKEEIIGAIETIRKGGKNGG